MFGIFDYYFFAIPLIILSTIRRRSVIINDDINADVVAANCAVNLRNFVFVGKPRSGNDANNVRFSTTVEQFLDRKVNITGDPKKCSDEYLVGDSGAGCSVIANPALLTHIRKSESHEYTL